MAPFMAYGRAAKVERPSIEVSRAIKPPPTMAGSRAHKASGDGVGAPTLSVGTNSINKGESGHGWQRRGAWMARGRPWMPLTRSHKFRW
jgi:hypothetical protein